MAEAVEFAGGTRAITEGEWAGWRNWGADPWEDAGGPFFYRVEDDGSVRCAFKAEARHMNGGGFMHGGCLMTFADYALFCIAKDYLGGGKAVTVTMNSEFLRSANVGDFIEATGEVVKGGRALIFVRGVVTASGRPVLTFSATLMKVTA
jgi:uncharacterized protein (TIGR00369 family)